MILQCEQCKARFRLDDEKIKNDGVKVRCSKCKHVFFVKKETAQDEADYDTILDGLGSSVPPPASSAAPEGHFMEFAEQSFPEEPYVPATSLPTDEDSGTFSFSDETLDAFVAQPAAHEGQDSGVGEFSFDESAMPTDPEQGAAEQTSGTESYTDTDFPLEFNGGESGVPDAPSTAMGEEFSFDFDEPAEQDSREETLSGGKTFDATISPEDSTEETIYFEPEETTFNMEAVEPLPGSAQENPTPMGFNSFEQPESTVPETFVLDSYKFAAGDDAQPVTEIKVSDPAATKEDWKFSSIVPQEEGAIPFSVDTEPLPDSDVIPPFPAAARRSGFSPFPLTAIILALLLALGFSAAGLYFVKSGPAVFRQMGLGFVTNWLGMAAVEEGSIVIIKPVAVFQHNKEAGELFVVSGEAVNNFNKPRASIHVKATLFDSKGRALLSKGAYCGNHLSSAQLATLPMTKIDEAMNNQFGDSLSNLGVKPGKGLPFVVAFANVPPEAVDYTVEVTGSTVASQ